ncbi:hypothetical protein [Phytohabitans rumicis]|uniref:Uncharacterized protein n=1 Tax=Phytohabitans rumicis TaxID=1076125 RepID=A0A6V8LFY3_9ACTN|nr:hypothetical protein [Phytohabitans rumicis]GFJ95224.1 hypothetical protein Prum_088660 [Phytohabitans rumicis]
MQTENCQIGTSAHQRLADAQFRLGDEHNNGWRTEQTGRCQQGTHSHQRSARRHAGGHADICPAKRDQQHRPLPLFETGDTGQFPRVDPMHPPGEGEHPSPTRPVRTCPHRGQYTVLPTESQRLIGPTA